MTFKSFLDTPCGLRYMFDTLELQSPCGRKLLLESRMMRDIKEIEKSYTGLGEVSRVLVEGEKAGLWNGGYTAAGEKIAEKLGCVRDISGTLCRAEAGAVLDDIELFEIKYLAMVSEEVGGMLSQTGLKEIALPGLKQVVELLDPDGLRISSFYVYDSYSPELKELRIRIRQLNAVQERAGSEDATGKKEAVQAELQQLILQMGELEAEIRRELSGKLKGKAGELLFALQELARLDILLAKALQVKRMGLCFPEIGKAGRTVYKGLFHPQIKAVLKGKGKQFTPIDLAFGLEPVTIIGANMGGKTVVLKMVALSQLLFQFGFGVPAQSACIDIKNNVMLCVGDEQNELAGLSSFAAEIKAIDQVLREVKRGMRILALIDEPARTTNPVEGTALVSALLKVLHRKEVSVLLTTHYNVEGDFYRRLRVKGLAEGIMDYRLEEAPEGAIPHEAVGIAESLGIDREWLGETKRVLEAGK